MSPHTDMLLREHAHRMNIVWATGYSFLAAIFAGLAFVYLLYCFFSRADQYRSQRIGAGLIVFGQLIVLADWQLRLHPVLHLGEFGGGMLLCGSVMTFVGLIDMARKQRSQTWLWF